MEIQIVELHFSAKPNCDYAAIKQRAEAILGEKLDSPDTKSSQDSFLLFHKQYPVQLKDAVVAPQTALMRVDKPIDLAGYEGDIQQSWGFRDCASVLATSKYTILVVEMMAQTLPPTDRARLFHGVLQAVIEITNPSP